MSKSTTPHSDTDIEQRITDLEDLAEMRDDAIGELADKLAHSLKEDRTS